MIGLSHTNHRIVAVMLAAASLFAGSLQTGQAPDGAMRSVLVLEERPVSFEAERSLASIGGRIEAALPLIGGFEAMVPEAAIPRLALLPGIRTVAPNVLFRLDGKPGGGSSPSTSSTHTVAVDAPTAWSAGYKGSAGAAVALLDSGIAPVADLVSPTNRIVGWKDFVDGSPTPRDPFGHGTYVAGIIAGNGGASAGKWKGVAPESRLVGIRVFDALGTATASRVVQGIQWAIDNRALYSIRVLNLSFSTNADLSYRFDAVAYAAEQAWKAGIVVVASAGNQGPLPGSILSPGTDPFVITVGSVDHRGTTARTDDRMASSSGAGPTVIDGLSKPDLVAPGEWNTSLRVVGSTSDLLHPLSVRDAFYFDGAGTSPAVAVVSGIVAMMLQRRPSLAPDQVKYVLKATTTAAPSANPNVAGAGYVNAYGAVMSKLTARANQGLVPSSGGGLAGLVAVPDVKMR